MKEIKRIKKNKVAKQRQADTERAITKMYVNMMALKQVVAALESRIEALEPNKEEE